MESTVDVDEDAVPRSRAVLDGGVAAINAGHQAAHQHGLSVKGAIVIGTHVLLDVTDGDLNGERARAVVKGGIGVVIDGGLIGASSDFNSIEHTLRNEQGDVGHSLLLSRVVVKATGGAGTVAVDGPILTVPRLPVRGRGRAEGISILELVAGVGPVLADHTEEVDDDAFCVVQGNLVVTIAVG